MQREEAWEIVEAHVQGIGLRRHMLAVEAAMRADAEFFGEDPEGWGLAGLLHDYDWEIHPTLEEHPQEGVELLRRHQVPEPLIRCILSHADHTGVPRLSLMEKALYACDELTGLITAVALIRPSHSLADLKVKSVRKKWNDGRFAAAVDRRAIEDGAADLGIDLWEHVGHVIEAMNRIAPALGLDGTE
jgi:putative nucleotidyltransferase with HDIG domain